MIWAIATLGLSPPDAWLEAFQDETSLLLPSFSTQHLSNIIWSFSKLEAWPRDAWLDRFYLESRARLTLFKASELAQVTYSLGLRIHQASLYAREARKRAIEQGRKVPPPPSLPLPPKQWLNQVLLASYLKMDYFGPKELSNIVWGLSKMGFCPGPRWTKSVSLAANKLFDSGRMNELDHKTMRLGFIALGLCLPTSLQKRMVGATANGELPPATAIGELQLIMEETVDGPGDLEEPTSLVDRGREDNCMVESKGDVFFKGGKEDHDAGDVFERRIRVKRSWPNKKPPTSIE